MNHDHDEIWHVQLPTGEVRVFDLDQLDAAFQVGLIDEGCYVRRDGSKLWRKLGEELAGEPEAAASPTPAPVVSYQPIYSTAPMVSSLDDELPASFRPSKGKRVVAILGGLAAVAALAVVGVTKLGGVAQSAAGAAAGAANVTTPVVVTPPAATTAAAAQLTPEQKKALDDMDKTNERKAEQRHKARMDRIESAPRPFHPSKAPFSKNGNKYDPLNAKL